MLSGSTSARHSSDFGPSAALTPRKNCISPHYLSPLLRKISSSSDSDIRSSQPMHLQLSSSSELIASVSFAQRTFRWEVQRSAFFFNGAQQVCAWMSYSDKLFWLHEYRVRSFSAVIDCCQNKRIPDTTNAANVNSKRYRNRHSQICHNLTFGSLKYSSLHESQRRLAWNLRERFEISKILAEEEVWDTFEEAFGGPSRSDSYVCHRGFLTRLSPQLYTPTLSDVPDNWVLSPTLHVALHIALKDVC